MSPTAKQTRGSRQQRPGTARSRNTPPVGNKRPPSRAGLIPWLAAGATLWAAVPPVWPGLGISITWSSTLFALAAATVAVSVARTAGGLSRPEDALASATTAGLLGLVVVVPVIFDPRTLEGFNLGKLTAALVGAVTIAAVWALQVISPRPSPRWRNGLHWPVLALVAWTAVTTATSVSPRMSILGATYTNDGFLAVAALAVIFFAVVQAVNMDQVKAVLTVLYFGAGGLTVLYGLIQLHDRLWPGSRWDWVGKISGEGTQSFADGRIFSTLGNPNHLGGFLAILVPVGLVLFLLERSRRVRILIVTVLAGAVIELLQGASRGAMLATLTAVGVTAVLLRAEVRRRRPDDSFPVAAVVAAVVVMGALALAAVPQFSAKVSGLGPAETVALRADLWKLGVSMANDRPLVGQGPDTWLDRSPRYQDAETVRRRGGNGYHANGAHNLFVSQLAGTGYPGLILLLAVLALATVRAIGTWRRLGQVASEGDDDEQSRAHEARLCLVGVMGGLTAFLVQGSFNLNQMGLSFAFWVLLGLLCVLSLGVGVPTTLRPGAVVSRPLSAASLLVDVSTPHQRGPRADQRRSGGGRDLAPGALSLVVCLGLGLSVFIATRPMRANHNAAASIFDLAIARAAPRDEAARLSRRATTRLDNAIDLNPWEASHLARRGDSRFASALSLPARSPSQRTALARARRDYERVLELRPYNAGFLSRYAGHLLTIHERDPAEQQTRAEAIRLLRRAVDADPFSPAQQDALERALAG